MFTALGVWHDGCVFLSLSTGRSLSRHGDVPWAVRSWADSSIAPRRLLAPPDRGARHSWAQRAGTQALHSRGCGEAIGLGPDLGGDSISLRCRASKDSGATCRYAKNRVRHGAPIFAKALGRTRSGLRSLYHAAHFGIWGWKLLAKRALGLLDSNKPLTSRAVFGWKL